MATRARIRGIGITLAVAAGACIAVLAALPTLMHLAVESRASEALEREVSVEHVEFDGWRRPRVTFEGLRVAAAKRPDDAAPFFAADSLSLELAPWRSLERGALVVSTLHVARPAIAGRRDADGRANWPVLGGGEGSAAPFVVEALRIDDGTLAWRDALAGLDVEGRYSSSIAPEDHAPLRLELAGTYRGREVGVTGSAGSPLGLADKSAPFPVRLSFSAGATHVAIEGHVLRPLELEGFDLDVEFTGPNPAELYPLIPLPLPDLPPYSVSARIGLDGDVVTVDGLRGTFGDSDVEGRFEIRTGGERLDVRGRASSSVLDFDDIAGLVGAPPSTAPGETASAGQRDAAREAEANARVIPNASVDFRRLRTADASIDYTADDVRLPGLAIEALEASLRLDQGRLELEPFRLRVAGGDVDLALHADAGTSPLEAGLEGHVQGVSLGRLLAGLGVTGDAAGSITGDVRLEGSGNSLAAVAATLTGEATLRMNGGELDNVLVEALGLDLGEALVAWLAKSEAVPIVCAVVDMTAQNGDVRARRLFVDTDDTLFRGDARADLGDERLAMRFEAVPRDTSLLSGDAPLFVHGSFANLTTGTDVGSALLSFLTPVEVGRDSPEPGCRQRYAGSPGGG